MIQSSGIPWSFGRPSPRLAEVDLARVIDRTVQLALEAKHELGFAAVNFGCDGRKVTTFFDGSTCETDGDVCIATRQDGITACIDTPAQGAGLVSETLIFAAPACVPVTGWWLVDAAGYMYSVPAALITAASYWPMIADPVMPEPMIMLVRAGTWAKLMCAAALAVPLNDGGGAEWVRYGEGDWQQRFGAALGGSAGWIDAGQGASMLLRDAFAPNAGLRVVTVTLPTADASIVSGAVKVAYGYPFGGALGGVSPWAAAAAPYPRRFTWTPEGTWQLDCAGRPAGDMALVYRRGLAVEYGTEHICLAGADITDLDDYVSLSEMDPSIMPPLEVPANVVALPSGEIVLFSETDQRNGQRYRVRPAPADPITLAEEHLAATWGDDPNALIHEQIYNVDAWANGATTFTVTGSGDEGFPMRGIPIVLWETDDYSDTYQTAPTAYFGTLGETVGGLTALDFEDPVALSTHFIRRLTVIGPHMAAAYGWTAVVLEDPDDPASATHETALSPLADGAYAGSWAAYSRSLTLPGGPPGTVQRNVYRLAWNTGGTTAPAVGPWGWSADGLVASGAFYDRMCRLIATHLSSEAEPGTDPVTLYDEDTSFTLAGTRPPSPLVYVGPVTVDAPLPVHLLQPLNL